MAKFPISATFIDDVTYDIPSSNWTEEQWQKELDYMLEVGIDTVVTIRGVFYNKANYPSDIFPNLKKKDEDFIGFLLKETEKRDMKVYLGLYISDLSWGLGDVKKEVKNNELFIDEIMARYGNYSSLIGWYIPHESHYNGSSLKETMGSLAKLCKEKTPDKQVLVSPFFNSSVMCTGYTFTPERTAEEWDKIWEFGGKYIDACAFQDGTASLTELGDYLNWVKKACDQHKISLWSNVETFERDVRNMFFPIPFDVMRKKIEIAKPYVDNFITFEFSHFLSPQSMFPSARNLNALYKDYYGKK